MSDTQDTVEFAAEGRVLEVRASGKLTTEFYERFVPAVERQVERFGKLRVLFVAQDFHGWTAGALWQDTKFELKHCRDIERLAIVGDSKWERGMAVFCKPFTSATIRYFDLSRLDEARRWIAEE